MVLFQIDCDYCLDGKRNNRNSTIAYNGGKLNFPWPTENLTDCSTDDIVPLSNWKEEACKISGRQRVSNPWPPRYQCDTRPTELLSPTLAMGASSYHPVQWNDVKYIWNSHMYCGCRWMWRVIIAVNSVLLSVLKQTITSSLSLTLSPTFAHKIYDHWNHRWSVHVLLYISWGKLY